VSGSRRGPTARSGSPPPPPGAHDLVLRTGRTLGVVIDTSAYLQVDLLRPLLVCAARGFLRVAWSTSIQREIEKVVYREGVARLVRDQRLEQTALATLVRAEIDRLAAELEQQFRVVERSFVLVSTIESVDSALLTAVIDPADRPVLATAIAAGAHILLSLDQRHLPHGTVFQGVECWHPDTFLTLFFQQNPDVYDQVSQVVSSVRPTIRRLLP
jgi:predicted nucleic acid-binding protein